MGRRRGWRMRIWSAHSSGEECVSYQRLRQISVVRGSRVATGGFQGLRLSGRLTQFGEAPRVTTAILSFLPTLVFRTALSVTSPIIPHDSGFKLSSPRRISSYKETDKVHRR